MELNGNKKVANTTEEQIYQQNIEISELVETSENNSVTSSAPEQIAKKYSNIDEIFAARKVDHPTSNIDTLMHLFKGNVGTGILAIPDSLMNSGLTFGVFGLLFVAIICIHCMHILLRSARHLCLRTGTPILTYASTTELAFSTGPEKVRKYAKAVRLLTNIFICITQLGFCSVYFNWVSTNIKMVIDELTVDGPRLDYRIYASIILVPIILTVWIRNLKYLVLPSVVANILQVVTLIVIFYYICQDIPSVSSVKQFSSVAQLPLWFGTVIYSFEGIGLVLPLENNMKTPRDYGGWTGVLNTGMSIVTCSFLAIGFYGYLKYGDAVKGSITLNLPQTVLAETVTIGYALATLLSYSLQFYVPIRVMWPPIQKKIPNPKWHTIGELAFRTIWVLITFGLAVLIPQLNLFISLVGSFGGSYLSVILPPIVELVAFWSEGLSWVIITKNAFIIFVGILGFATGTYSSIYQIIDTFGQT